MLNQAVPKMNYFALSSMPGRFVKTDNIDFSFYFSEGIGTRYANRAKIRFNRQKIRHSDFDGFMELYGNFKWHGINQVSTEQVDEARKFFMKYSILFDAVWDGILNSFTFQTYLQCYISFQELLSEFEVDEPLYSEIQKCKTLEELNALFKD